MSAPHRFKMSTPDPKSTPLQFVLEGVMLPDAKGEGGGGGDPWEETFTVVEHLPAGALSDLTYAITVTDDGDIEYNAVGVVHFLRAVIVPEDEQRFDALIRDKRRQVELQVLADVMMMVNGAKVARPTGPRLGSLAGSRGTKNGSGRGSSSRATRGD